MKVAWTEQAWERLLEIERFIARDDPRAAARLVDKLIDRGEGLARVVRERLVVCGMEGLVRTLAAFHLWQLTDAAYELVGACRRVSGLAGLLADEASREHIRAAPKQGPEQLDLGCRRDRSDSIFWTAADGRCGGSSERFCKLPFEGFEPSA